VWRGRPCSRERTTLDEGTWSSDTGKRRERPPARYGITEDFSRIIRSKSLSPGGLEIGNASLKVVVTLPISIFINKKVKRRRGNGKRYTRVEAKVSAVPRSLGSKTAPGDERNSLTEHWSWRNPRRYLNIQTRAVTQSRLSLEDLLMRSPSPYGRSELKHASTSPARF